MRAESCDAERNTLGIGESFLSCVRRARGPAVFPGINDPPPSEPVTDEQERRPVTRVTVSGVRQQGELRLLQRLGFR